MLDSLSGINMDLGGVSGFAFAEASGVLDDRWGRLLGRLHPLTVHFPIALAIAAAAVEFVNILRRKHVASPFAFTATIFAAIAACFAAWFGWLNADFEGATPGNTLFLHRWLGVAAAGGLVVVAVVGILGRNGSRPRALNGYRWGLLVCAVVVGVGAHFGGEMVYGDGYLTKVLFAPSRDAGSDEVRLDPIPVASDHSPSSSTSRATAISFRRDVLPILEERCVECHGPDKVKGGLRMDTAAAIFSDDPEWWTVQPGRPEESLFLQRVELPADDPDAMPPSGDRLTPDQIATIRTWIAEGALHEEGVATGPDPVAAPQGNGSVVDDGGPPPDARDTGPLRASVESLRSRKVLVSPIAEGASGWEVNASHIDPPFEDSDIERLAGLRSVLVWLQLSRSAVTSSGIDGLRGFERLSRLKLDHTSVGDEIVDTLLELPDLEMINLYATRFTDRGIERLATHPRLVTIYCDETDATAAGVDRIARSHPGLRIVGPESDDEGGAD